MDRNQTVHASARVCPGPRETTDRGSQKYERRFANGHAEAGRGAASRGLMKR